MSTIERFHTWQEYQSDFLGKKHQTSSRSYLYWWVKIGIMTLVFLVAGHWLSLHHPSFPVKNSSQTKDRESGSLSRSQVRALMDKTPLINRVDPICPVTVGDRNFTVYTSLEPELQTFLVSSMDQLKTLNRGRPRQIALVAMNGQTGQILAMTGFDADHPDANPCVAAAYPAASIFKIVTAAAAMDVHGYTPHSPLYYNGSKYTLYKRQLHSVRNRYTVKISLTNAFAQSVNPVFGKLGKNILGSQDLMNYAAGFGFNHEPDSDFGFETGCFDTGKGGYHLAELGCGFNTNTRISPVFGAMIVSAVLNKGKMLIPAVVDSVLDSNGQTVYIRTRRTYPSVVSAETADYLFALMRQTVSDGTARKVFRRASEDKVLSTLDLGGKTGSLFNESHTVRYDWFIGFGREKQGEKSLALAVVVGHGKYIGVRATDHAKRVLRRYFALTL